MTALDQPMAEIIVGCISAATAVVVAAIALLRRDNTKQHAENGQVLKMIVDGQERIESKIDGHLEWHVEHSKEPSTWDASSTVNPPSSSDSSRQSLPYSWHSGSISPRPSSGPLSLSPQHSSPS